MLIISRLFPGHIFPPVANAVNFDGTNDWLNRGADFTSNVDTKLLTFSVWLKPVSLSDNDRLYQSGGQVNTMLITSSQLQINFRNSSGTDILRVLTSALSTGSWQHIMGSFDLTDTGKRHLYVNNISDLNVTIYTDDTMDTANAEHAIGASTVGTGLYDGDMADFYLNFGEYIDLSVAVNREKFIDAGKPVALGSDGSTPTGTAPDMLLTNPTATWHTNVATGGGMTENGALTTASTSPSD